MLEHTAHSTPGLRSIAVSLDDQSRPSEPTILLLYSSDSDLKLVGLTLDRPGRPRNHADYQLSDSERLFAQSRVVEYVRDAARAIDLLDQVDGDDNRRAAAIQSVRSS